ncbi:MAG: thiolase domain-containing protein [Euryarchaeota archaeon]|nr:thiolase domain-containing protein [Euryarchaeota archaeon]
MREVAIIGAGETKYGEHWDKSLRDLVVEAGLKAVEDANITADDVQAIFGGNMSAGSFVGQDHVGALIADFAGVADKKIPAMRIESACASGAAALHAGYMAIASGMYDIVLVGGVEKMTDLPGDMVTDILAGAADREWEVFLGATFPALAAMMARRYMHEFGMTKEQMALFPVIAHKHGALNPDAHFQREITVDAVLKAPMVADPLTIMNCSPVSDGSAAVVLTSADMARKYTDSPIKISASAFANEYISLHSRESLIRSVSTIEAGRKAYKMAKKEPKDIDLVEIHDAFSIIAIEGIEDLGFAKKGEAWKLAEEGQLNLDGSLPYNPSGGLKAKGHPVGATGVGQVVEIVKQLRNEAGKRQVDGAEVGLAHNVGGTMTSSIVHILEVM